MASEETPREVLNRWETEGISVPTCRGCEVFYEAVARGEMPYNVFASRHRASKECKSGKRPHCTCDSCF